jgi:hypothetical protein
MMRRDLTWIVFLLTATAVLGWSRGANAADEPATGTWKYRIRPPGGAGVPVEITMKFVQSDDRLTGTYLSQMGQATIANGTVKGDVLAFDIVREGGFTIHYTGKIQGNTITGKTTMKAADRTESYDWEAKRAE